MKTAVYILVVCILCILGKNEPAQATHRPLEPVRATGRKQRLFASLDYGAHSWDRTRRVVVKAEHGAHGANPRFVVTIGLWG